MFNLFNLASTYNDNIAVIDQKGRFTYNDLTLKSDQLASNLLLLLGKMNLDEDRIAFMVTPGFDYIVIQWAIWKAGGIAVSLCTSHPEDALRYTIEDSQSILIITHQEFHPLLQQIASDNKVEIQVYEQIVLNQKLENYCCDLSQRAMILYTSGTTSKPKGVVTTFKNIEAQITALVKAWEWSSKDHVLNVLPMHHVHGIVNITLCALWSGAIVQFLPRFSEKLVFDIFLKNQVNLFMAVPTIYYKLITYFDRLPPDHRKSITKCFQNFRLMVSGSAALPIPTLEKWRTLSGHTLLERYGMTEIGMALSNPYRDERKPGHVGQPLPGVQVKLIKENGEPSTHNEPGEILIKGDNVFSEYWRNPQATAEAFDNGWFKSGDIAVMEENSYKILGRNSVDIIKSGGYKISALEIEEVLLSNDQIQECAVVGINDDEWGEVIAAAIVTKNPIELDILKYWIKSKLPGYKVPRIIKEVKTLPRNVLGKITKHKLKEQLKH